MNIPDYEIKDNYSVSNGDGRIAIAEIIDRGDHKAIMLTNIIDGYDENGVLQRRYTQTVISLPCILPLLSALNGLITIDEFQSELIIAQEREKKHD